MFSLFAVDTQFSDRTFLQYNPQGKPLVIAFLRGGIVHLAPHDSFCRTCRLQGAGHKDLERRR